MINFEELAEQFYLAQVAAWDAAFEAAQKDAVTPREEEGLS